MSWPSLRADAPSADEEVQDAVKDHNELRDAVRRSYTFEVGSDDWWKAVIDANVANSDHMGEEERQDLADLRQQASLDLRHELAVKFLRFMALKAATGIAPKDKDPQEYIEDHQDTKVTKGDRAPGPATDSLTASDDA